MLRNLAVEAKSIHPVEAFDKAYDDTEIDLIFVLKRLGFSDTMREWTFPEVETQFNRLMRKNPAESQLIDPMDLLPINERFKQIIYGPREDKDNESIKDIWDNLDFRVKLIRKSRSNQRQRKDRFHHEADDPQAPLFKFLQQKYWSDEYESKGKVIKSERTDAEENDQSPVVQQNPPEEDNIIDLTGNSDDEVPEYSGATDIDGILAVGNINVQGVQPDPVTSADVDSAKRSAAETKTGDRKRRRRSRPPPSVPTQPDPKKTQPGLDKQKITPVNEEAPPPLKKRPPPPVPPPLPPPRLKPPPPPPRPPPIPRPEFSPRFATTRIT